MATVTAERRDDRVRGIQMTARWVCAAASLLFIPTLSGCHDGAPPSDLATEQRPIVGGSLESGWEGVGALTLTLPWYGYQGSFCTATLIAPQWVLTAAHCLTEHDGISLQPQNVRFFVGTDARRAQGGGPVNGTLHQVQSFHLHPQYNNATLAHDIALVRLSQPLNGVPTYATNASNLNAVGQSAFYVGFGATEGVNSTGSGQKRSVSTPISWIYQDSYTSNFNGTGTCFGDSGGPGFLQFSGTWRIVGVNSAGVDCNPNVNPNCDPDPCRRMSIAVRVDHYATWLANTMNVAPPSCTQNPGMCLCPAACQSNGVCNDALCPQLNCEETYACLVDCGASVACQQGCIDQASPQAESQLTALFVCIEDNCGNLQGDAYNQCVGQSCGAQVDACFPVGTGPWTCRQVYDCIVDCPAGSQTCGLDCYSQGTAQAQSQFDALQNCLTSQCGHLDGQAFQTCASQQCGAQIDTCFPTLTGNATCEQVAGCINACPAADSGCPFACFETGTAQAQQRYIAILDCAEANCASVPEGQYGQCLSTHCGAQLDACFPPANCPLTGGGCPTGQACYPTVSGATDCFSSNGKPIGAACVTTGATLDCGDGAVCVEGVCEGFCAQDAHCGSGRSCEIPIDPSLPGVGICGCVDADGDGFCADVDCDDNDPLVYPGAPERCDGKDNNCNGITDEGCEDCVDNDGDGFCADVDCDDNDPFVYPGAPERCDGKDTNCNGITDEGCEDCVDNDGDGYCADVDCDDNDPTVYPGAPELCDGKDNNCDGVIDAGCLDGPPGPGPGQPGAMRSSSGCATSGGAPPWALILLALSAVVVARRRRGASDAARHL